MNSFNRPNDQRAFVHKRILGLAGGAVKGFLGGGPVGALGGALGGFAAGPGRQAPPPRPQPIPGIGGAIERFLPGGKTGFFQPPQPTGPGGIIGMFPGVPGGVTGFAQPTVNGACPAPVLGGNRRINAAGQQACPGFHWNESTYTRLGGPCSTKPAGLVLKGTEQIKNRRKFNTANGPARKRAIQRLRAGEDDCKDALRAMGYRTITKRSAREMKLPTRRGRHR